nr:2A [Chicken picornavirus 1]
MPTQSSDVSPPTVMPPGEIAAALPFPNPLQPAPPPIAPSRHGGENPGGSERCYIVRKTSLGRVSWALRSSNQQIGIKLQGFRCVVAYEDCEGSLYQEVIPAHFSIAQAMIGQPFPLTIRNTSRHWVERITNVRLPNIHPVAACCFGMGVLASLAAETVPRPEKHGLKDLAEASQNLQRAADAIDCAINSANLPGCAQQISQ